MANITHEHDWQYGKVYNVTTFADARQSLKRKPRTNARALTDCKVTRADGSSYDMPRRTVRELTPAQQAAKDAVAKHKDAQRRADRYSARAMADARILSDRRTMAMAGTIHNPNDM